ncbi:ABC transporter ATP-binding protein [Gemella bergeri]
MTNLDENKDVLNDNLTDKGSKTEDYSDLLEKIRQQVDSENNSTVQEKSNFTKDFLSEDKKEDVQENKDVHSETVVLNREDLQKAFEQEDVSNVSNVSVEVGKTTEKKEQGEVVLEVLGLKKRIGLKTIVDDITFEMRKGEITGLLGPNGSGKTTIMRMMVGLTKISKGDVYCFEKPLGLGKTRMLKEIGSMIETPEFYNYMSGWSNLKQIARTCGKKVSRSRIKELAEFVGLKDVIHKKVKTYSLGMRQRLGLAQALLNDPKILILDEPVNGLDPQGVQDFRNKLKEIAATGVSILISSHLLDEIERVSDRIIVIEKGRIIADDKLVNLKGDNIVKTFVSTYDNEKAEALIEELGIRYKKENAGFVFENLSRENKGQLLTYLVTNNVELDTVKVLSTSLEDRFLEITGKENK